MTAHPHLPPGPPLPRAVQGALGVADRIRALQVLRSRYGSAFSIDLPIFGHLVVLSDPGQVRELFRCGPAVVDTTEANLGRVMGPHSLFALTGDAHLARRKLLTPPFHGRRLTAFEQIAEQETLREAANWPVAQEFPMLPSMMRITLNVILRAVFGADGQELQQLRAVLPPAIRLGSALSLIPVPQWDWGRWSPWGRVYRYRREYDAIVDRLIDKALADPALADRDDVLATLLQSRYEDGSPMARAEIADELLTMLAAGHETTATTLAWAVERLQRHAGVLARLTAELDRGATDLLDATILEVLRARPVIDVTFRQVRSPVLQLGPWRLPQGQTIAAGIGLLHSDPTVFPDPHRFDPDRFLHRPPNAGEWMPYGGGVRRCIGAAFATMEMRVVLRTLLLEHTLATTTAPGERCRSRGVAIAPARGARVRLDRRT